MRNLQLGLTVGVFAVFTMACGGRQERPQMASSAGRPAYAVEYPERLALGLSRMLEDEQKSRQDMEDFPEYSGKLNDTDWELSLAVVRLADEEGRGQAYADSHSRTEAVEDFLEDEDKGLGQKIIGSVNYATKDKGCSESVGPNAYYSTKRAIAKQLKESAQNDNAAHQVIKDNEEALGKRNITALEDEVDAISLASFMAHVGLENKRRELERMSTEASEAESTLDRSAEDLQKIIDDPDQKPKMKKRAKTRLAAVEESRTMIQEQQKGLTQAMEEAQKRVDTFRKDYKTAFDALEESFEKAAQENAKSD